MPFCPDKLILAGFLGSFALYQLPALAGRHDDRDLIALTQRTVNNPHSAMQSESEKVGVAKKGGPRDSHRSFDSLALHKRCRCTAAFRASDYLYRFLRSPSADQHLDAHEEIPVRFELRKSRPHLLTHGAAVHVGKRQI